MQQRRARPAALGNVGRRVALCAALCAAAVSARAATIEQVNTRLFGREEFTSIGEYFTGDEHLGGRTILRTEPSRREGYYFVIDLGEPVASLPQGAVVVLRILPAASGQLEELRLPLAGVPRRGERLLVGLTEAAWAQSESPLLAWRVSIEDPVGVELAAEASFLWAMPQ